VVFSFEAAHLNRLFLRQSMHVEMCSAIQNEVSSGILGESTLRPDAWFIFPLPFSQLNAVALRGHFCHTQALLSSGGQV
jgi:hypothetical protein